MQAELVEVRDFWAECDFQSLNARHAWGDHNTLACLMCMLREHGVHARAEVLDSRGKSYDTVILAHSIYGVVPTITIRLAFARAACSLVALRLAAAPTCQPLLMQRP